MQAEAKLPGLPLVAVLRGVRPDQIVDVAQILFDAGIRIVEVPLNSPDPFVSIEKLSARFGDSCLCGAGTVLTPHEVERVRKAGGRLVVSPNADATVIARTKALGMVSMPGFATATEAFVAIAAGADVLKLFPATTYGPSHLRAIKAVLPQSVPVFAVGGVGAAQVGEWLAAGASGFGFGSELFRPAYTLDEIAKRARDLVAALRGKP